MSSGTVRRGRMRSIVVAGLLAGALGGTPASADNSIHGGGGQRTTGVIYKQGLVLEGDRPTFAEYDRRSGALVRELAGERFTDPDDALRIDNGRDYLAAQRRYLDFLDALTPEQLALTTVIGADEHPLAGYPAGIETGEAFASSRSLRVYLPQAMEAGVRLDVGKGAIAFESRYALEALAAESEVEEGDSLLIGEDGSVVHRSEHTIGYRVAYIEPGEGSGDERSALYRPGDTLLAPIDNAWVENARAMDHRTGTDAKGRYETHYRIPLCPGFTWNYKIPIFAGIPFRSFNPQREGGLSSYLLSGTSEYTCAGLRFPPVGTSLLQQSSYIDELAIHASLVNLPTPVNFAVDVTLISGRFALYNDEAEGPIPLGPETVRAAPPERDPDEAFEDHTDADFDRDGEPDHVSDIGSFGPALEAGGTAGAEPISYGVWFSVPEGATTDESNRLIDADGEPIEPDLIRVADRRRARDESGAFAPLGLVSAISAEDLRDTDLYVFRSSTGDLVMEKSPFAPYEQSLLDGVDEESGLAFFELTIPGREASDSFRHRYSARQEESYEAWQASRGVARSVRGRADSLRVGEPIRVIAINRATGYIGTADTSIEAVTERDIRVQLPEMKLLPPNLKVHVQRRYTVESGLSVGAERRYTVGSEGASLTSDQYLSVHTEWLERDGSALPSELPGYSGRLASLVANGRFGTYVGHFDIEPGKHIEVLELPGASAGEVAAHSYLHVVGRPLDDPDPPSFEGRPGSTYPHRPAEYVPIRVALYDERRSEALEEARRAARADRVEAGESGLAGGQGSGVYQWVHRPEMMFSVFDLDVTERRAESEEGEPSVIGGSAEIVTGSADTLVIEQSMSAGPFESLSRLDPYATYAYLVGEGANPFNPSESPEPITIANPHDLDADGFLAVRLINNQDSANVLSEWIYQTVDMIPLPHPPLELSADRSQGLIFSAQIGGASPGGALGIEWDVEGAMSVQPRRSVGEDALHLTTVDIRPYTGTEFSLRAKVIGSDDYTGSVNYTIVPGAPAEVTLDIDGTLAIEGIGEATLTIDVEDRHGNTVADGTLVTVEAPGLIVGPLPPTVAGRIRTTLRGDRESGLRNVTVTAGDAVGVAEVSVHDIDLQIDMAETFQVGDEAQVRVIASSTYGILPDFEIGVSALRGGLGENRPTVRSNVASLDMPVGNIPGSGRFFATLGDDIWRTSFTVEGPERSRLTNRVLIEDVAAPGTLSIDGTDFDYSNETTMVVQGAPGETIDLSVGDFLQPPFEPIVEYPMQDAVADAEPVLDAMRSVPGTARGLRSVDSSFGKHARAYELGRDDALAVADLDHGPIGELGFVLNVRADALSDEAGGAEAGTVLRADSHGLALRWEAERLVASYGPEETAVSVGSEILERAKWYPVAVHVVDAELILQVGEAIERVALAGPPVSARARVQVGGDRFEGQVSALKAYDWAAPLEVSFDGGREASIQLDATGQGAIDLRSRSTGTGGTSSAVRSRIDECLRAPVEVEEAEDFLTDVFSQGEAFARNIADCVALPQIREHVIRVQTAEGFWQHSVAVTNLVTYSAVYGAAKYSEVALAVGPECARGVIFGSPDSFPEITCDLITSILLVGDLRDFAYHSWWLFWDSEDDKGELKYDRATYIFASLGIATSFASPTGVGLAIDAAVAGCKVAAKVMKGSELPLALAIDIERRLEGEYFDLAKVSSVVRGSLDIMSLTGVVILFKDEFGNVYDIVRGIDRQSIGAWRAYLKTALGQVTPSFVARAEPVELPFWIGTAYGINRADFLAKLDGSGAMRGFIALLDDTFTLLDEAALRGAELNGRKHVQRAMRESIRKLGKALESADNMYGPVLAEHIEGLIAKDSMLSALSVVYDISPDNAEELLRGLTRYRCTRSNCDFGGLSRHPDLLEGSKALEAFFATFTRLSTLRAEGKITDEAYTDLRKVLKQMGSQSLNIAKGGTEVLATVIRLAERGNTTVLRVELEKLPTVNGAGDVVSKRQPDALIRQAEGQVDRIRKVEQKSWDGDIIESRLLGSLRGADGPLGQLRSDMVSMSLDSIDAEGKVVQEIPNLLWRFDGLAYKAGITSDDLVDIVAAELRDPDFLGEFLNEMQHPFFGVGAEGIDRFRESEKNIRMLLGKVFEVEKTP